MSEKIPVQQKEALIRGPLQAEWGPLIDPSTPENGDQDCIYIVISIPEAPTYPDGPNNNLMGFVDYSNTAGLKMAHIESADIHDNLKGEGLGKRLYMAFTKLAKEHGAEYIAGASPSADAMNVGLRLFGYENTRFFDKQDGDKDHITNLRTEIPLDEYQRRLDLREQLGHGSEEMRLEFYTVSDVRNIDTSNWELDLQVR